MKLTCNANIYSIVHNDCSPPEIEPDENSLNSSSTPNFTKIFIQ